MSDKAKAELDKAMKELLEAQRVCAWCNKKFETATELAKHIMAAHPDR